MRYCATPGCGVKVVKGHCRLHQQAYERSRPNLAIRTLYRTPRWATLRARKYAQDPLCVDCRAEGLLEPWTDLDHQVPHRGDLRLFWDEANLVGRCKRHHSRKTQRCE